MYETGQQDIRKAQSQMSNRAKENISRHIHLEKYNCAANWIITLQTGYYVAKSISLQLQTGSSAGQTGQTE